MVMANGSLRLLSGRTHPKLASQIARRLRVPLCGVELGNFSNGEISCRIEESVRGCDVFILQTHYPNVNDSIYEQALIIDAAKRASAKSITAICPFFGYARQDRKSRSREPIAARLTVDFLAAAGAARIITVDLHSGQTQGFFSGPFDHLITSPILQKYLKKLPTKNMVIVSPDAGRVKLAERYSSVLSCDMAIIHKNRAASARTVETKYLIGKVGGRICVIVDDMIDTAGTICAAAKLLEQNGAKAVYCVAGHGLFSGPAMERIKNTNFKKIIVTDTVQIELPKKTNIEVLPTAPLIAKAIKAVYEGKSVSALFGGRNVH